MPGITSPFPRACLTYDESANLYLLCDAKTAHSPLAALSTRFLDVLSSQCASQQDSTALWTRLRAPEGRGPSEARVKPAAFWSFSLSSPYKQRPLLQKALLLPATIPLIPKGSWLRCDLAFCLETRRSIMHKLFSSRRNAASTQAVVMFSSSA
jgi:hypothetical protein